MWKNFRLKYPGKESDNDLASIVFPFDKAATTGEVGIPFPFAVYQKESGVCKYAKSDT